MSKEYLGDSVYANADVGGIELTTENGSSDDPSNTIYLEYIVVEALVIYYNKTNCYKRNFTLRGE